MPSDQVDRESREWPPAKPGHHGKPSALTAHKRSRRPDLEHEEVTDVAPGSSTKSLFRLVEIHSGLPRQVNVLAMSRNVQPG
nr:hypothetical protein [Virgisporangium aurantiacum]